MTIRTLKDFDILQILLAIWIFFSWLIYTGVSFFVYFVFWQICLGYFWHLFHSWSICSWLICIGYFSLLFLSLSILFLADMYRLFLTVIFFIVFFVSGWYVYVISDIYFFNCLFCFLAYMHKFFTQGKAKAWAEKILKLPFPGWITHLYHAR